MRGKGKFIGITAVVVTFVLVVWYCVLTALTLYASAGWRDDVGATKLPVETRFEGGGVAILPSEKGYTWFEDKGMELSPIGAEVELPIGDKTSIVKVFVDETTVGCKEGRKNVFAQFRYTSKCEADVIWCSAFDRYTGTSFSSSPYSEEDALKFEVNDEYIGVFTTKTVEMSFAGQYTQQVVVNCPDDYEGVVFQIAPVFGDMDKEFDNSELHSIEDFSVWGKQLFFAVDFRQYVVQTLCSYDDVVVLSSSIDTALKEDKQ